MIFNHPALKACNSPYMKYYFKLFLFCIPRKLYFISDQKVKKQ